MIFHLAQLLYLPLLPNRQYSISRPCRPATILSRLLRSSGLSRHGFPCRTWSTLRRSGLLLADRMSKPILRNTYKRHWGSWSTKIKSTSNLTEGLMARSSDSDWKGKEEEYTSSQGSKEPYLKLLQTAKKLSGRIMVESRGSGNSWRWAWIPSQ